MAVLCEGISVVIKADRLIDAFGSFDVFREWVPNKTLAADNELVRVGFMDPEDVQHFVQALEARGLIYVENSAAQDIVVIDQMRGPMVQCDWVEFGKFPIEGHQVSVAHLSGSDLNELVTPEGWKLEGSLTQTFSFVPLKNRINPLKLLRAEDGLNVYLDPRTGKKLFLGKAKAEGD